MIRTALQVALALALAACSQKSPPAEAGPEQPGATPEPEVEVEENEARLTGEISFSIDGMKRKNGVL